MARFAASALILGVTMIGCRPAAEEERPAQISNLAPQAGKEAAKAYAEASRALDKGKLADALLNAEQAVLQDPDNADYRLLLANIYLQAGRFASAETTFGDVVALDPANSRAALSAAIARIATGRAQSALALLDRLEGKARPADLGLAYALAGDHRRAIAILDAEARSPRADGRVRQNLALAHALAGDWQQARIIAAQDVAPDELDMRLARWARIARPGGPADQVAAVLGVRPSFDTGQPVRLALAAPSPETVHTAQAAFAAEEAAYPYASSQGEAASAEALSGTPQAAEVAAAPVAPSVYQAPASITAPPALPSWAAAPYVGPAEEQEIASEPESLAAYAIADVPVAAPSEEEIVPEKVDTALASVNRASLAASPDAVETASSVRVFTPPASTGENGRSFASPAPAAVEEVPPVFAKRAPSLSSAGSAEGRYVVQIGSFQNPDNVERAWRQAMVRYGFDDRIPSTTTIELTALGTMHRLSVGGFDDRAAARSLCGTIKAKGGDCFVRQVAGDAPVQWAWLFENGRA
ncbi:MAG: SPOR domain-containing protein [Sphingomonadaceae bacterium]